MQIKQLLKEDDAVSPVIGVILMVAITVILAAVIASFVLGLGPGEAAPTASFDISSDSANHVTVTFDSGQKIDATKLSVQVDGKTETFSAHISSSQVSTGDSLTVTGVSSGTQEVRIVWESGDSSQTIDSGDVTVG